MEESKRREPRFRVRVGTLSPKTCGIPIVLPFAGGEEYHREQHVCWPPSLGVRSKPQ